MTVQTVNEVELTYQISSTLLSNGERFAASRVYAGIGRSVVSFISCFTLGPVF